MATQFLHAFRHILWMQDLPCDRLRLAEIFGGTFQLTFQLTVLAQMGEKTDKVSSSPTVSWTAALPGIEA